jgi:serine/threonine protein kinase/tetratricopeptide (TPR) repeat protein
VIAGTEVDMIDDRRKRAEDLFQAAADLPAGQRSRFIGERCGPDEALRAEVERLVRAHEDDTDDGLDVGAMDLTQLTGPSPPGESIGPYKLLSVLGEGGMGVVYLAEQTAPVRRRVAIKVLKGGMDPDEVVPRFELERQLLGSLNHAGIARLYDGGTTGDGRPYFVMEYVEGQELGAYCDAHRLSIDARLRLFQKVCAAVHCAHQNLVVHQDIKPGNILVTSDGEPKLLDFGIAKLLNPEMSLLAGVARPGGRVMTPEYASPEQVRGEPITTASDVYALGVLLYELLTGHAPYRLESRAMDEIERVICEQEPASPSTAVGRVEELASSGGRTTTITPETVGRVREERPDRLRRALSGDLDRIVLMAMRKVPMHRYASAEQLSEDIQRHRGSLPVIARPDTVRYRATKFVRRNRTGVAAAAMIVVVLVGGILGTTSGWRNAEEQRQLVEVQRNRVTDHRRQLVGMSHTLMFDVYDLIDELEGALEARELLVTTAQDHLEQLATWSAEDPTLRHELAMAYDRAGDIDGGIRGPSHGAPMAALEFYEQALALRQALLGDHPDDAVVLAGLAASWENIGDAHWSTRDLEASRDAYVECLSIRRDLARASPRDDQIKRLLAVALRNVGKVYTRLGGSDEAERYYDESIPLTEELVARYPDDLKLRRDLSVAYLRKGGRLRHRGDLPGALVKFQQVLRIRRRLAAANPDSDRARRDVAVALLFVGQTLHDLGRPDEAMPYAHENAEICAARVVTNPLSSRAESDLAVAHELLGQVHDARGETEDALLHFRTSRDVVVRLSARHPGRTDYASRAAIGYEWVARALDAAGDRSAAVDAGLEALERIERLARANPGDALLAEDHRRIDEMVEGWMAGSVPPD